MPTTFDYSETRSAATIRWMLQCINNMVFKKVYEIVCLIPKGKVMTYGQISELLSHSISARAVGWAMNCCPKKVPWHRVVNASGGISTKDLTDPPELQRFLLENEGIRFSEDGRISLGRYQFNPEKRAI